MKNIRMLFTVLITCGTIVLGQTAEPEPFDREKAVIELQKQTEKLLAQAQKEGGVLLVIYYGLRPDHLPPPPDYPAEGAKFVSNTAGQSLMSWGKQIKEESAANTFAVGFVNFVEMDGGIRAAQVQVKELNGGGKEIKRFAVDWVNTQQGDWRFLGVEDPPENWIEVN